MEPRQTIPKTIGWGRHLIATIALGIGLTVPGTARQSESPSRFTYTEYHMGVDARIVVYAKDKTVAEKACTAAFERMAQLDSMMSDYRKDSELMKLCDKAGGTAVRVSPEMFKVFKIAERISRESNGSFDVTVGPLVKLWRAARKTHELPEAVDIQNALKLVGWQKVKLNEADQTVQLGTPGMRLDFGGIAKGYCDDEVQTVLKKFGIKSALVEMGGDVVVSNPPPGKKGWTIEIPHLGKDKGPLEITVSNCAISTSGDTEQFVVIGGKHYSHVVDPRTGYALTSRAQATVIAPYGLLSDPLSKGMTILSQNESARFLKKFPGTRSYFRIASDE